ncbi:MAG TPA: hypothetical protein VGS27_16795 [Candidatus Sulfotelmatobacter sp.]|nr:hypothetical protein [Candidatus Sulfotelmatobacter sp.]HEV2469069.1 hypothetical protein [Candidatus Sulfotelmatobacter sp.]
MRYAKWIAVLMLAIIPSIAGAQTQSNQRVVAHVPFTYTVANTVIPLGETTIQWTDPTMRVLKINNAHAGITVLAPANTTDGKNAAAQCSLVFHKYGRRYFLVGMKIEGSAAVYSFGPSKSEGEMFAQNVPGTEEILLASLK